MITIEQKRKIFQKFIDRKASIIRKKKYVRSDQGLQDLEDLNDKFNRFESNVTYQERKELREIINKY